MLDIVLSTIPKTVQDLKKPVFFSNVSRLIEINNQPTLADEASNEQVQIKATDNRKSKSFSFPQTARLRFWVFHFFA